jgi:hypothetical protein
MSDTRQSGLRGELRVLQGARQRLEAASKRKAQPRHSESRVDKLVGLFATQPLRNWYIEDLVDGLPGIPGGRARMEDRERAVRAAIGQTQQRGLIENTGRRRYRLTSAGREITSNKASAGSNGSGTVHLTHAIAELKKEEQAVSEELRKVEKSLASSRSAARASSKRVQPGEYGTQLDQLVSAMVARPDREWSIDDMLQALLAKGWKTSSAYPEQIVRNNITHALNLGLVRRVGRGRYRIRPQAKRVATTPTQRTKRASGRSTAARTSRSSSRQRSGTTRGPSRRTGSGSGRRRTRQASKR